MVTEHGIDLVLDAEVLIEHLKDQRVRHWMVTITCKQCPTHFEARRITDSKSSIIRQTANLICPECMKDTLEIHLKDEGPAEWDEPCVCLDGKPWIDSKNCGTKCKCQGMA